MTVDTRPWNTPAPYPALRVFVTALEYASHGDADSACITLAHSDVPPAWVRIQAVDTLAGACRGPDTSAWGRSCATNATSMR
jgi:hypothetical protein